MKRHEELEQAWLEIVKILKSVGLEQWSDIKKELGESFVAHLYNGTSLKANQKGSDVLSHDGERIQVKFRTTSGYKRNGELKRQTSLKNSNWACDKFVEVLTDPDNGKIKLAIEYDVNDVQAKSAHDAHDNINVTSQGKLKDCAKVIYER